MHFIWLGLCLTKVCWNGHPAPSSGHGARTTGQGYLPAGHGARMGASARSRRDLSASSPDRRGRSRYERQRHGNMAGRETDKWFIRRALPVATWFLCLGTGLVVTSPMIGRLGPIIQLVTAISSDDGITLTMVTFRGVMIAPPGHGTHELWTGPQYAWR